MTDPTVSVVAVEPADEPRAALERRFAGDARVTVSPCAVADTPGSRAFYVTAHSTTPACGSRAPA